MGKRRTHTKSPDPDISFEHIIVMDNIALTDSYAIQDYFIPHKPIAILIDEKKAHDPNYNGSAQIAFRTAQEAIAAYDDKLKQLKFNGRNITLELKAGGEIDEANDNEVRELMTEE